MDRSRQAVAVTLPCRDVAAQRFLALVPAVETLGARHIFFRLSQASILAIATSPILHFRHATA